MYDLFSSLYLQQIGTYNFDVAHLFSTPHLFGVGAFFSWPMRFSDKPPYLQGLFILWPTEVSVIGVLCCRGAMLCSWIDVVVMEPSYSGGDILR